MTFFRSLRGKLILTYTLVTVLALLAVEVLVLLIGVSLSSSVTTSKEAYLSDVLYVLYPQASAYLQPGHEDLPGLQSWLETTYESGLASWEPQYVGDSPAAHIVQTDPMYVLSPRGEVLAHAPGGSASLVGRSYSPPDDPRIATALENARQGILDPLWLSVEKPDGNLMMLLPVLQDRKDSLVLGTIVLTVTPPPAASSTLVPVLVGVVLFTAALLLLGVAPFGALFGFVMSRGLTRRLKALSDAADAWSEGNFTVQPKDRSQDEIGHLGMRMRHMAERIQTLMQSQHELALLEERNRLARELHDTIKQQAFASLMQVRAAKNLLEKDPASAISHLEEAEALIKTSQQELGLMIAELRPAALEGQGMAQAVETYLHSWSQQTHIPADFQVQNERRLPLEIEQALYRVAQEALSNIARHSRASQASLRLEYTPGEVRLVIADNGTGFDASQPGEQPGYGLQSMLERVEAVGGQLSIHSAIEQGTILSAVVPLPGEKRGKDGRQN